MRFAEPMKTVRLRAGNLAMILEHLMRAVDIYEEGSVDGSAEFLDEAEKAMLLVMGWGKDYTSRVYNALKDLDHIPLD